MVFSLLSAGSTGGHLPRGYGIIGVLGVENIQWVFILLPVSGLKRPSI